jgi:hypothetical protein
MSSKIITLELTQKLHDLKIVKDLFFESDTTQNFVLELNIDKNDLIIISTIIKIGLVLNEA